MKRLLRAILGMGAVLAMVGLAPMTAQATEITYYNGSASQNTWYSSGNHTMSGARVLATSPFQWLSLWNEGLNQVNGWDNVYISHSSRFIVSRCAWTNSLGGPPGTTFPIVCKRFS